MPQRVRVVFRKRGVLQWVSHLDTMRAWERTLRRAGLPLVYTQGFSPHPRIALAAPLPVGFEGERELMDIWLDPALDPGLVHGRLEPQLAPGLEIVEVEEVAERLPSLQSLLRTACYRVSYDRAAVDPSALEARLATFLALESLSWEERRGDKSRTVDVREGVLEAALSTEPPPGGCSGVEGIVVLTLRLSLDEGRGVRAQSVVGALGVEAEPLSMVRTELELERPRIALDAWRARGRYEE